MIDRAAMSPAVRIFFALGCALAAGCAGVRHAQTETVPTAPPAVSIPVTETPMETAPQVEPTTAVAKAPKAPTVPAPPPPVQPAPATRAAVPDVPVSVAPATPLAPPGKQLPKPAAAAALAPAPEPTPAVVPRAAPAAPQQAAAPLDLKSLEARLRQTKAIGVLTKLSLKNQVDDLVDGFRAYHKRTGTATLANLRRNYDMLVLKVLSLLQDSDPSLARDIVKSRAAIWGILEDPRKFTESNLMAGATP
jgi:hypothetical protein